MGDEIQIKELIRSEYIKCASSPIHFAKKYCYISHPKRGRILFNLYNFQEKLISICSENDNIIINKSRQLGISTLVAMYSLWIMLFNKDKTILVIATKQETAKNMVTKVKYMYDNLPSWLKGKNPPLEDNKLSLKLPNQSQIIATASSSDAGRSYAASLLIIDEAAFIDDIDRIYTSIKPTLATGGGCIALSSPNGVGNWFHKRFSEAEIGKGTFLPITLPWNVHPERDQKWFDDEASNMSPRELAQEYCCDFLASGNTLVDANIIAFYEQTFIQEPIEKRLMGGDLWIWSYVDYSKQYIVTADVARGDGLDYSTFHVIEITSCEQVAEFKSQIGTRDFGALLVSIATEYNNALLVVENSNIGWDVVNTIIERNYPNLYYSPRSYGDMNMDKWLAKIESEQTVAGFTNSTRTRPLVISKLEAYTREQQLIIRSKRFIAELRVFVWKDGKAQAQQGYNDDLIMAMGFGMFVRDTALKFYAQGQDMTRNSLNSMVKTQSQIPYPLNANNVNNKYHNMYKQDIGRGEIQDLREWLL